jgi:hypothetical protein
MTIRILPSDTAKERHFLLWLDVRCQALVPGRRYRLQELLAVTDWDETSEANIDEAYFFSRLITTGRVPFEIAGIHSPRENLYRYTPSERVCGGPTPLWHPEKES